MIKKRYHVYFVKFIVWKTRNVRRYYIFRASSFAKFVCRSRKWPRRKDTSRKTQGEVFWKKKRGKGRRKRKDELQREEIIGLIVIIKKKLLLSNYLEQNYAQVLQFQSKVLCQEKKKNGMKPEWTIAIQKNKLN